MYCYVWSYSVDPAHLQEFRSAYGPEGDWVRLFRRDGEYVRTELLGDIRDLHRFLTIDSWTSREGCVAFRERFAVEFEALDGRCERFTTEETHLGDFETV